MCLIRKLLIISEIPCLSTASPPTIDDHRIKTFSLLLIMFVVLLVVNSIAWLPPHGWTGPAAALYRSFDVPDGLTFMEGATEGDSVPLVCDQVY